MIDAEKVIDKLDLKVVTKIEEAITTPAKTSTDIILAKEV